MNPKRLIPWFFETGDGASLHVLRKLLAAVALIKISVMIPFITKWFSNDGWLDRDTAFFAPGQQIFFSVLKWLPDPFVYPLVALLILACLCILADYYPKWATVILFLGMVSLDNRNQYVCNGFDRFLRILIAYVALAANDLKGKRAVEIWPQRLLQIQIAVMYASTFAYKVLFGKAWIEGYAIREVLNFSQYHWIPLPHFFLQSSLPEIFTYTSLALEGLLGTLIFWRRATYPLLIAGILLHLGVTLFISIPLFNLLVIFSYVAFIPGESTRRTLEALKRRHWWVKSVGYAHKS